MCNSSEENLPELSRFPALAVFYGAVGLLGLPLNAVSLWVLLCHHGLKSSCAVFMFHLTLSDLLLVFSLPARIYEYTTGTWPFSTEACTIATLLFSTNIRSSALFMTFIGVDRLLAVVYPLRSRNLRSTSNAWKATSILWLVIWGANILEGLTFNVKMRDAQCTCFEYWAVAIDYQFTLIRVILSSTIFLVLLAVNVVSTAMVSWTLRSSRSDAACVNKKMNIMYIFALNLLMFLICFLPVSILPTSIVLVEQGAIESEGKRNAIRITVCLATLNCCLDPLLYHFILDGFWKKKEGSEREGIALARYVV